MPRWSSGAPDVDRRLVQGLNQGDEEALGALYDTYAEQLFDYCVAMVTDERTAAYIVHDAFIDAQRRAPRMRDRMQLRAWLYAAVRRRCLQQGGTPGLSWEWAAPSAWAGEVRGAEADVTPQEAHRLVEAILARLDFLHQEALLLTQRHGLSSTDVSVILGTPPRRTTALVAQARESAEKAVTAELRVMSRHCQAGRTAERPGAARRERTTPAPAGAREGAASRAPSPRHAVSVCTGRRGIKVGTGGLGAWPGGGHDGAARRGHRRTSGTGQASPDPGLARHMTDCADCWRRGRVAVGVLLDTAPAPVLPATLRYRVMHTATDPELAAHRADIAARGGTLTPDGLPRQPDVPSQYTRRWLFIAGCAAGALLSTLVVILMMSPVTADLRFPFDPRPQPPVGDTRQEAAGEGGAGAGRPVGVAQAEGPGADPDGSLPPTPPGPHFGEVPPHEAPPTSPAPSPSPSDTSPPSPPPPHSSRPPVPTPPPLPLPAGELNVGPASVTVGRQGATITLTAEDGPVSWTAVSTSSKLTLSAGSGTLEAGASVELKVLLADRSLINLPGEALITVTDANGDRHDVQVKWRLSLL